MCDFAVRPSPHKRLSKLILAVLLSKAVQIDLEQCTCSRVKVIGTTAFTNKPVSMKYRGLFEVHNRGEGYINYFWPGRVRVSGGRVPMVEKQSLDKVKRQPLSSIWSWWWLRVLFGTNMPFISSAKGSDYTYEQGRADRKAFYARKRTARKRK